MHEYYAMSTRLKIMPKFWCESTIFIIMWWASSKFSNHAWILCYESSSRNNAQILMRVYGLRVSKCCIRAYDLSLLSLEVLATCLEVAILKTRNMTCNFWTSSKPTYDPVLHTTTLSALWSKIYDLGYGWIVRYCWPTSWEYRGTG